MQNLLTNKLIIALFPSFFMLHELEEIIKFHGFDLKRKKLPGFVSNIMKKITTLSVNKFATVVLEEFLILLIVSVFCICFECPLLDSIYVSIMCAYNIHILVHVLQSVVVRGYVPGLVLGVISLFITSDFICRMDHFSIYRLILFTLVVFGIIVLNLFLMYSVLIKKGDKN